MYDNLPISFGCGVNSVAMTIMLVNEGWRGPILFADTGTEWPETYEYLDYFNNWLKSKGLEITIVGGEWRIDKKVKAMSLIEYCEHYRITPFPRVRWCTKMWKTEPLERWCEAHNYKLADTLIGIAANEAHRQPERIRPLVERGIDRDGCIKIIQDEGLKVPRKSGCWLCPLQSKGQWRELWEKHPDLFNRASRLEQLADARRRLKHPNKPPITTLGRNRKTLAQLAEEFIRQSIVSPEEEKEVYPEDLSGGIKIAKAIYEAARLEAEWSKRSLIPEKWQDRDGRFREQYIRTVQNYLTMTNLPPPDEIHANWMRRYLLMGWDYGEKVDRELKTHPDLVPYDELPKDEKDKDAIFLALIWLAQQLIDIFDA